MDWITPNGFAWFVAALILLRGFAEWILDRLNLSHLNQHRHQLPKGWESTMDETQYQKALDYTKAKGHFSQWSGMYGTLLLLLVLFSGALPFMENKWVLTSEDSVWKQSGFMCFVMTFFALFDLPWNYYSQFRLEDRFGFNKSTPKLWIIDQIKMFALGWIIGWPLLTLLLFIIHKSGPNWWLWAWGVLLVFQIVMIILAPMIILPMFNKLTPLEEGSLKDCLIKLADRTGFGTTGIQVMDGSRRSGHSNAFFTGFGSFRRIVLFDTLIEQLNEDEVEGVLAHEIGHFKKKHVLSMMLLGLVGMLVQLWILAWLAGQSWFFEAFGFEAISMPVALLLFVFLIGTLTFWISPLNHLLSRKFEYQADAYAVEATQKPDAFVGALRKISLENLSNPVPHPLYSFIYYSHPTLLEREHALGNLN